MPYTDHRNALGDVGASICPRLMRTPQASATSFLFAETQVADFMRACDRAQRARSLSVLHAWLGAAPRFSRSKRSCSRLQRPLPELLVKTNIILYFSVVLIGYNSSRRRVVYYVA
jgi:hypothetical protein